MRAEPPFEDIGESLILVGASWIQKARSVEMVADGALIVSIAAGRRGARKQARSEAG